MTLLQAPAPEQTPDRGTRPVWGARVFAVCVALVTLAFLQDPGRIAADTKLDLTVNPWQFLGRALNLWDEQGFFGQLQNQAYGYLWPMGPFFGIGQSLGLPDWVVQRLWWSLLLVAAFLGMYLLLRALRVADGWPQILAGLAYALAVRPQSGLAAISVEIWPMAMAPWVLIPLVRGARQGNVARAAALSALAVFCAGGVNAVAAGAVLPLAVWWLITLEPGPRRRRLVAWWSGLTLLAILWWLVPLFLLGSYSPPFLDWIESATYTTSITDPVNVLRGADHWLAYLGSAAKWTTGWLLATSPLLVIASGVVAAAGVAGLAMRSLPHRAFLVGGAFAGLVLVTAGHTGVFSGLGSEQIQGLLDGAASPLRNVHKFDLVLRIPLVVGFAHLLATVWPSGRRSRWRVIAAACLTGALVITWWPALSGQIARDRTYVSVADHWREASVWLNEQADPGRALIVPGASFGQYVWGRPQDEPLQAFGGYPWGVRDAVPLSSAGNIRMLDAIEARLIAGRGSKGLAEYLNRMGVRYLVVRNDLSPSVGAPLPIRVHQALDSSPGLNRVAFFGPIVDQATGGQTINEENLRVSYPAVEIYEVRASNAAADPRAILRPVADSLEIDGGPEALLPIADVDALGNRVGVLAGDPEAESLSPSSGITTDTDRRREITFGQMRDHESTTMTPDQQYQQSRTVHDYRVVGEEGATVAEPGLEFDASSSASDVGATWRFLRGAEPAAAMDGQLDTYWRPGSLGAYGAYWEVRYPEPVKLGSRIRIALLDKGNRAVTRTPLSITTDQGSVDGMVFANSDWQSVRIPPGPTRFVRVTQPQDWRGPDLGIREIGLPGEGVSVLRLPAGAAGDGLLLTARPGDAGPCAVRRDALICSDDLPRFSQDRAGLHRVVTLASDLTTNPRIQVLPRDTSGLSEYLPTEVRVSSSSNRTSALAGSGPAAFDRRLDTTWQAAPDDPKPTLTIELPESRTLRGIRVMNKSGVNASFPLQLQVSAGGRTVTGYTDTRGLFTFDPVTTDRVEVSILSTNAVRSRSAFGEEVLPVGISELALVGADDLRRRIPDDARISLPCGMGPDIVVDEELVSRTSVSGRMAELVDGTALNAVACESPVTVPEGQHTVAVKSSAQFQPVVAAFLPDGSYGPTGLAGSPDIEVWESAHREVAVAADEQPRVLEIAENFNPGWQARTDEGSLQAVRVDGWKQGFVVPAGTGGRVTVEYAPNSTYRAGLVVGLLAVLIVALVAIKPPRGQAGPTLASRALPRVAAVLVAVATLLVLGPWGLLAFGVAALVLRRRHHLPAIAFAGVLAAVALSAAFGVKPGSAVTVLQGFALTLAFAAVARAPWPGSREGAGG